MWRTGWGQVSQWRLERTAEDQQIIHQGSNARNRIWEGDISLPWNALATNFQSIDNLGSFRRTVYMFFCYKLRSLWCQSISEHLTLFIYLLYITYFITFIILLYIVQTMSLACGLLCFDRFYYYVMYIVGSSSCSFVSFPQFSPTCGRMPLPALSLWPGRQPSRPRLVDGRRGGGPSSVVPRSRNPPTGRHRDSHVSSSLFVG